MMKSSAKSIYPFFETIRIVDGRPHLLDLHQQRVNHVFKSFYPSGTPFILSEVIRTCAIESMAKLKCRIAYNQEHQEILLTPYARKKVTKLCLREAMITYPFKFTDRTKLDALSGSVADYEDVLITQNGRIREVTFGNIILCFRQKWYTPQYPIFYGVMRRHLLDQNKIIEKDLFVSDLSDCSAMMIINAMLPFDHRTIIEHWDYCGME